MSHEYGKDVDPFAYAAFLDALGVGDSSKAAFEQAAGADLASTTTPQEKLGSAVGTQTATFGTSEQLEQEKQTLIDMIREAGGNVGPAVVEGIADLGNLVAQAITLGKGPQLEAVIPNILDLIKGRVGGKLVFGSGGSQQSTVIGTGQTGLGRGTKVAVGGILGTIANIFKQGGGLGHVIRRFPDILIDNLPDVISAAAAAGYAFTDDDKQTVVRAGFDPSILDADDTTTTTPTTEPEAIVFTPTDQQYETVETAPTLNAILGEQQNEIRTPAELEAMLGYETAETTKTPAELATILGFDTATTVRSPGELTGMLGFDTATTVRSPGSLFGGVGYETAETVKTPAELATMLSYETGHTVRTPAEIAAILDAENIQTIRSSGAPTLTTTLGGGGGGGGLSFPTSSGVGAVSVEPGPLVDIPGFYDISSMSIIPDYIDELIERSKKRQGTA